MGLGGIFETSEMLMGVTEIIDDLWSSESVGRMLLSLNYYEYCKTEVKTAKKI
jgi:hypothetical protein